MASGRRSLAQQLAELEDPTPIEIDPDEEYVTKTRDEDENSSQDDALEVNGRAHYIDVGRSKLRGLHESLNDPKYAGQKITHELGQEDTASEEETSEEEESSEDDNMVREDEPARSEETDEESDPMEDNGDLNNVLKQARDADRLKGKAISRQIDVWDALLDARIRIQKASSTCNTLPTHADLQTLLHSEKAQKAVESFLKETIHLSNELVELQETLIESGPVVNLDRDAEPPRKKRKVENGLQCLATDLKAASKDLTVFEQQYHPYLLATLQKWSAKIQAVNPSALLPSSRNAFRTNRNAHLKPINDLIQESLSDHSRLVSRTRVRRGPPRMNAGQEIDTDVEGKTLGKDDLELFDDTDFYQQLLRDVIEGQTANASGETNLDARPKKVKKLVDTRASKGRKLRYEVHEKIQNFMVPIPLISDGWHEEKIDDLFSSLLGNGIGDGQEKQAVGMAIRDGFRIFG
ncbi:SubName: Full=Uncharacterized protein {ECO:0000313/EMBL:CCA74523.1} [Serendipita indica DSM 11827]|nr:SubName: Full=Uncharacterized protein {ECO:0000313/EMBL:CCA74523.1} [Serendipita indica DSM 11827]